MWVANTAGKSVTTGRQATAGTPAVVDTGSKFATGVVDTGGKVTYSSEYLPPMTTTPVANNGSNIRLLTPHSEHVSIYVNTTTQICLNNIFKGTIA
jgi:hypothetical protein